MRIQIPNTFFLFNTRLLREPPGSRVHDLGFWQDSWSNKTNIQKTLPKGEGKSCWDWISSWSTPPSWAVKVLLSLEDLPLACAAGKAGLKHQMLTQQKATFFFSLRIQPELFQVISLESHTIINIQEIYWLKCPCAGGGRRRPIGRAFWGTG